MVTLHVSEIMKKDKGNWSKGCIAIDEELEAIKKEKRKLRNALIFSGSVAVVVFLIVYFAI